MVINPLCRGNFKSTVFARCRAEIKGQSTREDYKWRFQVYRENKVPLRCWEMGRIAPSKSGISMVTIQAETLIIY